MPVGYIYKLESSFEDPGLYIGSTVDLNKRKIQHKSDCNNPNRKGYNYKLYQYIRDYGGWSNWFMLTLEEFEYETKEQLREREDYWIKELKANLNSQDAVVDKERLKNYHKNYHKNYQEEHREKVNKYTKKYREENREKILKKKNEKIDCECGGKYLMCNKSRHLNSKKHQSYLSSKVI